MLSPASPILCAGAFKIAAATVSPPRPRGLPAAAPDVARRRHGRKARPSIWGESPQAHDPLAQKPELPPRELTRPRGAPSRPPRRRPLRRTARGCGEGSCGSGRGAPKRRSPVLFYLLFAAACWAVYVRDREGVRWTH